MRKTLCFFLLFSSTINAQQAIFAGGCFWCMEADFKNIPGVTSVTSGYDGGKSINPSYSSVSKGLTNYVESIKVTFDIKKITYKNLLKYYWQNIDPLDNHGQFCDKGNQYKSVIFYLDNNQRQAAKQSKLEIKSKLGKISTKILPSTTFYKAENYHQNYAGQKTFKI